MQASAIQPGNLPNTCDFENDDYTLSNPFCNFWMQAWDDDFDWTKNKGETLSPDTGPGPGKKVFISLSSIEFCNNDYDADVYFASTCNELSSKNVLKILRNSLLMTTPFSSTPGIS